MKRSSSDNPQDSLTPRQQEILDFIRNSLDERGAPRVLAYANVPRIGSARSAMVYVTSMFNRVNRNHHPLIRTPFAYLAK